MSGNRPDRLFPAQLETGHAEPAAPLLRLRLRQGARRNGLHVGTSSGGQGSGGRARPLRRSGHLRTAAGRLPQHLLYLRRTGKPLEKPVRKSRALLRRSPDRSGGRPFPRHGKPQIRRRPRPLCRLYQHRIRPRSGSETGVSRARGAGARPLQARRRHRREKIC